MPPKSEKIELDAIAIRFLNYFFTPAKMASAVLALLAYVVVSTASQVRINSAVETLIESHSATQTTVREISENYIRLDDEVKKNSEISGLVHDQLSNRIDALR